MIDNALLGCKNWVNQSLTLNTRQLAMKKRTTLNLLCATLGMITFADVCPAATHGVCTALVTSSFLAYAERPAFLDSQEIDARAAALLKQMTLAEKLGQLTQFSNGAATGPDNVKIDQGELAARGRHRFLAQRVGRRGVQRAAEAGRGTIASENPAAFRPGRDPRSPHGVPHPPRAFGRLGYGPGPALRPHGCRRGNRRRYSLDVLAHGGHRPRRPLGKDRGGQW